MTVVARDITKTYADGTDALRGVSLDASAGVFGMIGPNGAGKTTLLRVLTTQLALSTGSLTIFGIEPSRNVRPLRRRIGYVPQHIRVVDDLTVRENLELFYDLYRLRRSSRRGWVDAHIDLIGLANRSGARAGALSGGERRKLGFAIGIIHRPELLICDEITTGLDPGERVFFRNLIAEIGTRACVIFSTHILEDISSAADKLCVLVDGRVEFAGRPGELIEAQAKRVWQVEVEPERLDALEKRYPVTERRPLNGRVLVKLIASEPPPGATAAPCRLDDAFLSLLPSEKRGEFAVT
ncbi:MAG: ABC transporter ATP-binding protein [Acidobacteriota bacterium]